MMNQLDYQPGFTSGTFYHNNQALSQAYGAAGGPGQNAQQQQHIGHPQLRQQVQQHQAQQLQQQQPPQDGMYPSARASAQFTAAPYSQPLQTNTVQPISQQQAALRQSASPSQPNSPFSAGPQQQQQQQQQQQPQPQQQVRYPMAAPPLPSTPISTQQLPNFTPSSAPSTPQSPVPIATEQNRIKLLLDINQDLIEEISNLQEQNKGGATNPQYQAALRKENMDDKMATEEYIQALRRLQANIAYMAPRSDKTGQPHKLPGPAHMTPPAHMAQLKPKYDKLRELFPGWNGLDSRQPPRQQQQQQQAQRSAAAPSMGGNFDHGNMNGVSA